MDSYKTGGFGSGEAAVARWIFDRYLSGYSLDKIAAGLKEKGTPSPSCKPKWDREGLNKLLSNEMYTGPGVPSENDQRRRFKTQNDGFMDRRLYSDSHDAIFLMRYLRPCSRED